MIPRVIMATSLRDLALAVWCISADATQAGGGDWSEGERRGRARFTFRTQF